MISNDLANERPGLPAGRSAVTQDSAFFGPAPIVLGESADTYADILARVFDALKPADILETFQARDIVDHEWEILRCRRRRLISSTSPS